MSETHKVFVFVVSAKLNPGGVEKFKELFKGMVEHVTANEPGCLSYILSDSDKDPDRILIYERYVSKEYFEQVHDVSEPLKKFKASLAEAGVEWLEVDAQGYHETSIGFLQRH